MHERFNRKMWVFRKDFTAALAKCLVSQSPYPVPDKLEKILADFHEKVPYKFDEVGMAEVDFSTMAEKIYKILESMPDVMALSERKNGKHGNTFASRFYQSQDPDDDFIDIMAVARNMSCEFADKADAKSWCIFLNHPERKETS